MLAAALAVLVSLPTIPGVREWHPGHGELRPGNSVELVLGSRDFISNTGAGGTPPRVCATAFESQIASIFAAAERSTRLR